MIEKEKRRIYAFMLFVLISLLFFNSVAFGQVPAPQSTPKNGTVSGTVFFNDGKTPFNPPSYDIWYVALLQHGSGTYTHKYVLNSTGQYNLTDVDPSLSPYTVILNAVNATTGFGDPKVDYTSAPFNVTAGAKTVVNLTTSRMLTN